MIPRNEDAPCVHFELWRKETYIDQCVVIVPVVVDVRRDIIIVHTDIVGAMG